MDNKIKRNQERQAIEARDKNNFLSMTRKIEMEEKG